MLLISVQIKLNLMMNKKIIYGLLGAVILSGSLKLGYAQQKNFETATVATLPSIFPSPVFMELQGESFPLGQTITLVALPEVSEYTKTTIVKMLNKAGVKNVNTTQKIPKSIRGTVVVLGVSKNGDGTALLSNNQAILDSHKEGYVISSGKKDQGFLISLMGHDAHGLFHATQSFAQLITSAFFPSLLIQDYPAQPIRGSVEGFYGKPWTMLEREQHLLFLSSVKANTYVYTPKDDPYARDRWREPYPADTLSELGRIAKIATDNHINFVYAISPGPTICFSCKTDFDLLKDKVNALRSVGVRSFYLALDDIEYQKWNCNQDSITFGKSGPEAAAVAQSSLLNKLQDYIKGVDPEAPNLIMVPTEYYDAKETPYKAALRKNLNQEIVVQWTGTDVVPPSISINDAKAATKVFGKPTLLWDNYPVNDYAESKGRLLLAPYDRREAGLSKQLAGILSNPMNQEAASRVAISGVAAFAWNDQDYDASRTWTFAARQLAGNNPKTTQALLLFFDTQHLAPTFGTHPWQVQAPSLKLILDKFRDAFSYGNKDDRAQAIKNLINHAHEFRNAPNIIRSGTIDKGFVREAGPWLDAMTIWGEALESVVIGLQEVEMGKSNSIGYFDKAEELAKKAAVISSTPGATRFEGPVKIADGVLDVFIKDASKLLYIAKGNK